MRRLLPRLARDQRGVTVIEFAIVAPVMMILLMGISDLAYQVYAQSILNGAMQKAGRDSTIQGAGDDTSTIDGKVTSMVQKIAANASVSFTRKSYASFSVVKPEPFVDSNGNGVRDAGECYTDINGNGRWDSDPGMTGQGGANDVTVYTATVTYPHLFPVGMFGWPSNQTITATTLLKNQPYASQSTVTPATICT